MNKIVGSTRIKGNVCDIGDKNFDIVLHDAKAFSRMTVTVHTAEGEVVRRNDEYSIMLIVEKNS